MKKVLIVFLLSSFVLSAFALDKDYKKVFKEVAPFCEYYENLGDTDHLIELLKKEKAEGPIEVYRYPETDTVLNFKDLAKWRFDALDFRRLESAQAFRKKLSLWTMHLSMKAKSEYHSAFKLNVDPETQEELRSCIYEKISPHVASLHDKLGKSEGEEVYYRNLINRNFIAAISLAAVIEKIKITKESFLQAKQKLESEIAGLQAEVSYMGLHGAGVGLMYQQGDQLSQLLEDKKALLELEENTLTSLKIPYYEVAKDYPLLFEFKYSPKILNWMNQEIVPSQFYRDLIKGMDDELWEVLKATVALNAEPQALLNIFYAPELEDELTEFFQEKYEDGALRVHAKQAAESYVNELNDHALSICKKEESHKLHYNFELVQSVFSQNRRSIFHSNLTVKDQAGYCELLRRDPPKEKEFFGQYEKLGISAFAVGMVYQFFTAKAKMAYSAYTTGSAAYAWNGIQRWEINSLLRNSTFTMIPNGFTTIDKYKELLNEKGDIITAAITEILFSSGAATVLRYIDKSYMRKLLKTYDTRKHDYTFPHKLLAVIRRGKYKQALVEEGSAEAKKLYTDLAIKQNRMLARMEGKTQRAITYKAYRDFLGYKTGNTDWSAFLSFRNDGPRIERVMRALDKNAHKTAEGRSELATLMKEIREFKTTEQTLLRNIDRSYNANKILPELEKIDKAVSWRDFRAKRSFPISDYAYMENGVLHTRFEIMENGQLIISEKKALKKGDFKRRLNTTRSSADDGVSKSISNELGASLQRSFLWSHTYDDFIEAANDYRLFEALYFRLKHVEINYELTKPQERLLKLLTDLVKNKPPQLDALLKTLRRELRWETYDGLARMIPLLKNVVLKDERKIQRLDASYEKLENLSPIYKHIRLTVMATALTLGSDAVINMFREGSSWHQRKEWLTMYYRDLQRLLFAGNTLEEKKCAKEIRPIAFLVCFHENGFYNIGYEWSLGINSDEPFARDLELKRKMRAYADRMIRLRKHFRTSEVYGENRRFLTESTEHLFVEMLVDRMAKALPDDQEISKSTLAGLVGGLFAAKDDKEFLLILEKMKAIYPENIVLAAAKSWNEKGPMLKQMAEEYRLPASLVNLIDQFEYSEPAGEYKLNRLLDLFDAEFVSATEQNQFDDQLEQEVMKALRAGATDGDMSPGSKLIDQLILEIDEEMRKNAEQREAQKEERRRKREEFEEYLD